MEMYGFRIQHHKNRVLLGGKKEKNERESESGKEEMGMATFLENLLSGTRRGKNGALTPWE